MKALQEMTGLDLLREELKDLDEIELQAVYDFYTRTLENRNRRHRMRWSKMITKGLAMPWDIANEIQRRDEES
jgi:hypothetical protein